MVRDFLAHLVGRANGWVVMPGTGDWAWLGDAWLSKARSAHAVAAMACQWEDMNFDGWAADAWGGLFGTYVGPVLA